MRWIKTIKLGLSTHDTAIPITTANMDLLQGVEKKKSILSQVSFSVITCVIDLEKIHSVPIKRWCLGSGPWKYKNLFKIHLNNPFFLSM